MLCSYARVWCTSERIARRDLNCAQQQLHCCNIAAFLRCCGRLTFTPAVFFSLSLCRILAVESLIYWRDVKKSGIVFGAGLAVLLAVSVCSVISVVAYTSLLTLIAAISFRIYKNVLQAVQKTPEGHPFQEYLNVELALPQEKVQECAAVAVAHVNALVAELRRLFLVEDLIDSIKFGALLWGLTYLGSWFNGITLVILGE